MKGALAIQINEWVAVTSLGIINVSAETKFKAQQEAWKQARVGEEVLYIVPKEEFQR